jgi:chromatin segregation and condensation protein Rec8/ScpA/Scc1 (kleisin family)
MPNQKSNKEDEYNFKNWTVKELREFASINNITIPSSSRKADIVELLNKVVAHPEFVDRTKEENLDEELIVGSDSDEETQKLLIKKKQAEIKFWQRPPFKTLLNYELAKESDVAFYDLSSLVDKFFSKMLSEDFINYKVSGIALKNSASLHRHKIHGVIKQEEEIQKQQANEKLRKKTRRRIPKTLSQPIKPKMKTSSQDELFDAMRAAIIDTMQKKEKLKRRRIKREEKLQKKKQEKSKAQLPNELLKHITGKEMSVEELHESWYNKIRAKINFEETDKTSFFELLKLINEDEDSVLGRKYELVKMFLALMFLSTNKKIKLLQDEEFKDIEIGI